MDRMTEIAEKEKRVRRFLAERDLDAIVLSRQDNFSWITAGGDSHVVMGSDTGVASVLLTLDGRHVLCENIEARRIMEEELADLGFTATSFGWWENGLDDAVRRLGRSAKIGADTHGLGDRFVGDQLPPLRYSLLPGEVERYRALGRLTAEAMEQTCFAVRPGMSERRVAGTLAHAVMDRGATPTVVLIAADERINHYRHPIPKDRKVEKCVMLVVCAKRGGLILSTTRLVHFGDLSADLRRKHDACARIDATFILGSRPGAAVKSIFEAAMQEYALAGFPDEWQLHHQGGATGYSGRDYRATPTIEETVQPNQAFAWNPSITGTKSEDTVIAFESGPEVLSPTPGIPSISVIIGDAAIERSDILVRDG